MAAWRPEPMIVCCGEALMDCIAHHTTLGRDGYVPHVGGSVLNTAIGIGRLMGDGQVAMLSGISTDRFGKQLLASMQTSHVDTRYIVHSDRPSTLAFVHLDNGQASYSFYDEGSAGRMLYPEQIPHIDDGVSCLFFGGISLAVEPCADFYLAVLERYGSNRLVMLDPNIRADFIGDTKRYCQRLTTMMAMADIVKVSDEDLAWLVPSTADRQAQVATLLDTGVQLVVVTQGEHGATAYHACGLTMHQPGIATTVVDTVGAGDAFNAGLLSFAMQHSLNSKVAIAAITPDQLGQALTCATRVAGATVGKSGADMPWAGEVVV